jgi:hypothetical protein
MSKADAEFQDGYLVYPGLAPQAWGICHLRLITRREGALVIVSEIRHNPGPSITNAIQGVWSEIRKRFPAETLGPRPLLVEHYNDLAVYGESGMGERLALVDLDSGGIGWRHLGREELAALSGCAPALLAIPLERLILKRNGE